MEQLPAPSVASEAIIVVDLVESTASSVLFGWHAVGRGLTRDLRQLIFKACSERGMQCVKSTGDGYLITFANSSSAEVAAISAVEGCFDLMKLIAERNQTVAEEHAIKLRIAIHFGEVDVVDSDREGPTVSFAFRMEGITQESLRETINVNAEGFPNHDYVICSEQVAGIIRRRSREWKATEIGFVKFKGFTGLHEIFRIFPVID